MQVLHLHLGTMITLCLVAVPLAPRTAHAQNSPCRFICDVELKIEPTFTIENLARPHRIVAADGTVSHAAREWVFETVLAADLSTRVPRLGFTLEVIASPFRDGNEVALEFEANLYVLTDAMTRGWVTSHFDIVNQFSQAKRPGDTRAYTNKLDFELDTAFHPFNRIPEGRWLHGLEIETSLDYLATNLPKRGDVFPDGTEYLDHASPWSLSFVIVVPFAPF